MTEKELVAEQHKLNLMFNNGNMTVHSANRLRHINYALILIRGADTKG